MYGILRNISTVIRFCEDFMKSIIGVRTTLIIDQRSTDLLKECLEICRSRRSYRA
jgi:hypothetical protein